MAMKGHVVRGTPVHHIDARGGEGRLDGKPTGMEKHTVHDQYDSDRRGYQSHPDGGTPYHSEEGNPPGARREVLRSTNAESSDHGNQNDPHSNGRSVMLEVGDQASGYAPRHEPTMDSPVPTHAPIFDRRFIAQEDRAHLGSGIEHLAEHENDLRELDGVMSRGIMGTSKPASPEDELVLDDDRPESAGAQEHARHNVE